MAMIGRPERRRIPIHLQKPVLGSAIIWSLCAVCAQAAMPADSAIFNAFNQADGGLAKFAVLQRTGVTDELDLVIAIASPKELRIGQTPRISWSEDRKIGIFLQEKARPERVYPLGIKSGFEDCNAWIERATATDTVISCVGEKSARYPNQKWVYDVRAKSLVKQFSYPPYTMHGVFSSADGAVFVGTDRQRLVAVAFEPGRESEFRVLSAAESPQWFRRVYVSEGTEGMDRHHVINVESRSFESIAFGPSHSFQLVRRERPGQSPLLVIEEHSGSRIRPYPLPQSTYDEFAAARQARVKDGYVRRGTTIEEEIGPWQLEMDKLWFGKTFYDGEGFTGVGGFGYFEAAARKYHLFAPPEIAASSVSAIHVEADAVWMALARRGEYGGSSGGLLRYDRSSRTVRQFDLPDIGRGLIRAGGKILAATDFGIAVVEGDQVKRYFLDLTTDGRLRVAPATR